MGLRQRDWAKRARLALIEKLGGKCVDCGSKSMLELDHIAPCTWEHEKLEQSWRISVYRREAREGKLTVRCKPCNVFKARKEETQPHIVGAAANGIDVNGHPF